MSGLYFYAVGKKLKTVRKLNRIAQVLKEHDKTQTWLSDNLDIDFRTVNRYIHNHNQPSLERLAQIAKILGVPGRDLINF